MATYAQDTYTRTVSNGWGTADTGGSWTRGGGSAPDYGVTGSTARIDLATSTTRRVSLAPARSGGSGTVDVADQRVTARFQTDKIAVGGYASAALTARYDGANEHYRVWVRLNTDQTIQLQFETESGGLVTATSLVNSGLVHAAATWYWLTFEVEGAGASTALRAKIWQHGTAEPGSWLTTHTDTTTTLRDATGGAGARAWVSASATNLPVRVSFDDFAVVSLDVAAPQTVGPGTIAQLGVAIATVLPRTVAATTLTNALTLAQPVLSQVAAQTITPEVLDYPAGPLTFAIEDVTRPIAPAQITLQVRPASVAQALTVIAPAAGTSPLVSVPAVASLLTPLAPTVGSVVSVTPLPVVVPILTLEQVLRSSHRPVTRLLYLTDLDTVLQEVPGRMLAGSVSMDRLREQRRSAGVSLVNEADTSLVMPYRLVRLQRGAYVNDVAEYVSLMTGFIDESATTTGGGSLSFNVWSRLRLADQQFNQPMTFVSGARLRDVVRTLAEFVGLGTSDDWYDLGDGGATLTAPRSFDVTDNVLRSMVELAFHHGLELLDDGEGRVVLRPFRDPAAIVPTWDFTTGLISLQRTVRGALPVNRQEVTGVGPDMYPVRASLRDLNPESPSYNPPDGSGPLGDRPGTPYVSAEIRTQQQANAVALRLLYERNLATEEGRASAVPVPLVEAGDVVLLPDGERVQLDTLEIPLGEGAMTMSWRVTRSLVG